MRISIKSKLVILGVLAISALSVSTLMTYKVNQDIDRLSDKATEEKENADLLST